MKAHKKWQLRSFFRQIWLRVTLFSLLGLLTALCGLWFNEYVPDSWVEKVGADAVDSILTILASSMLAVTTFSLSTMLGAFSSASSSATPRATQLLIQDHTTQNVLSTFVGAFVFSMVGIISLQTEMYGARGQVIIFVVTLAVVVFVVFTLLRWISHLMKFGRLGETTERVERVAERALRQQATQPFSGAQPLPEQWQPTVAYRKIYSPLTGYVQHIDVLALAQLCTEPDQAIYCVVQPGSFVSTAAVIAYSLGLPAESDALVDDAFVLGVARSFDQDPRFALCTLSEVASRALSPAVNDPGTAIDVISRGARLFADFDALRSDQRFETEMSLLSVFLAQPTDQELFDDFFTPIARDGASLVEVLLVLLNALEQLALVSPQHFLPLVQTHSQWIVQRAELAMSLDYDKQRIARKAQRIQRRLESLGY